MQKQIVAFLFVALFLSVNAYGQRGKQGDYTVSSQNVIVNTYTRLTADVDPGETSVPVSNNQLVGAGFTTNLAPGDLIFIYQIQGAWADINEYPVIAWGLDRTVQQSWFTNGNINSFIEFGDVTNYTHVGKYEFAEVASVSGTTTIELTCGLKNKYRTTNRSKTQIVRVPRYQNLTVPTNTSITAKKWDGVTGGLVVIEVEEDLNINGTGKIAADECGFRGGLTDGDATMYDQPYTISDTNQRGNLGTYDHVQSGEKGESIYGTIDVDYVDIYSRYGYGSITNGGGGGGTHNAGGGGGSNVGIGNYYGYGVINRGPGNSYDPAWNFEGSDLITKPSAGGGRGGYSHAAKNQNPLTVPPHSTLWDQDFRRIAGGVGGHPLTYDPIRAFFGGGGGGGHQNDGYGGNGGAGGGAVFISVYGNITGNGKISANGEDGEDASGPTPDPVFDWGAITGVDGAGGAGGGGSVVIKNTQSLPSTIKLEAKGGKGGNEFQQQHFAVTKVQANGPGGGGAGGLVSFSVGAPTQDVSGGASGTTNASIMNNFPPNGASGGANGMDDMPTTVIDFEIDDEIVCYGASVTLTVNVLGNTTPTPTINWYDSYFGTNIVGTGTTFTTPNLTSNTTYYIGTCEAPFRVPVEVVVSPQITLTGVPPTIQPETCYGNDGSITGIIASGGTGSLTFEWNGSTTPSENLTNSPAGTYTLVVTDAAGCSVTSGPYTINSVPTPTLNTSNVSISQETCVGSDGSITGITVSGGTSPYTYEWNGNPSPTINLTGASSGTYTLVVTDANGCSVTAGPFTINSASSINVDASGLVIIDETCNGNDGSITGIIASGGTGTLTYSWTNSGGNAIDVLNAPAGSYTLTVTDGAGCSASSGPHNINLIPNPSIDDLNVSIVDETCNGNDGSITGLVINGGTSPYSYTWNGNPETSVDLTGLTAGTYTLVVTDANGCVSGSSTFTIQSVAGPVINESNVAIQDETCLGNDGSITGITVSGGVSPYTYQWNGNNSIGEDLNNVGSGTYTLTVTDANGCVTTSSTFTINQTPAPTIDDNNITIVDESCVGNDGSITGIIINGGTSPYTYEWNGNNTSTADLQNAVADNYTLVVTDANGCTVTSGPYQINHAPTISIDISNVVIVDESCEGNNGSISGITASGGTGTLTFTWSTGSNDTDLTGLSEDDYSLTVTDMAGCSATAGPFHVGLVPPPVIDASNVVISDETCAGNDGSIVGITVSGGTQPYTYEWNGVSSGTIDLTNAVGGNYTLVVTDAEGCSVSSGPHSIVASPGPAIDVSNVVIVDESCNGNDGSITNIIISGGASPVTFTWNGQAANNLDLSNLEAGTYILVATDANGCNSMATFVVEEYPEIEIDVNALTINHESCNGNDGSITNVIISGGVGTLTYQWSNGATSSELTGLVGGSYTLVVTDALGCSTTFGPYIVNPTSSPIIDETNVNIADATCGENNGSITGLVVTGGAEPYTFDWNGEAAQDENLHDVAAGSYVLTVTDANGCSTTSTAFVINASAGLTVDVTGVKITDASCAGNDGAISGIIVTGGTPPFVYEWNGISHNTIDLTNAPSGTYTFVVTDSNGCSGEAGPFTINGAIVPSVNILTPDQTIEHGESVSIEAEVTPEGSSNYVWTPSSGLNCIHCLDPVATPDSSTWYVLTVTSQDGCVAVDSVYIKVEDKCKEIVFPTIFSPNGDNLNDTFCVLGNCIESMELQIYNRWGERIFQTTDINECWDGTYKGKEVNTGVYVYQFKGIKTDGTNIEKSGNINLMR